jgi:hypothetical protein
METWTRSFDARLRRIYGFSNIVQMSLYLLYLALDSLMARRYVYLISTRIYAYGLASSQLLNMSPS